MRSQWITSWIIWLRHHKKKFSLIIASFSALTVALAIFLEAKTANFLFEGEASLVLLSMLLMSLLAIKLLDSLKTAVLLLFVMLSLYFITSSLFLILGIAENEFSVLARVVIVTLMMSHLIHFLTALLREMARGLHQYDAIIEALAITHQPILLSSLTTMLGFAVVSFVNTQFSIMAYQVIIGVVLSYASLLVLVPIILLQWLLEFRVGHYSDRHGLDNIVKTFVKYPPLALFSQIVFLLVVAFMFINIWFTIEPITALLSMLFVSFILLLLAWQKISVALITILVALFSVLFAISLLTTINFIPSITALVLLVPIGIVLDDAVHFFTRYIRAEKAYISDKSGKVKYSLNSVGRPIWLTSQLLIVGLFVLLFSENLLVVHASAVTILALIFVSFILLWVLPSFNKRKEQPSKNV